SPPPCEPDPIGISTPCAACQCFWTTSRSPLGRSRSASAVSVTDGSSTTRPRSSRWIAPRSTTSSSVLPCVPFTLTRYPSQGAYEVREQVNAAPLENYAQPLLMSYSMTHVHNYSW